MCKNFFDAQKEERLKAKADNERKAKNKQSKSIYVDPLEFRKTNQKRFSTLARVAKTLLGIPITSAWVERHFSKNGFIMRQHRRNMADHLGEDLFFIKENY